MSDDLPAELPDPARFNLNRDLHRRPCTGGALPRRGRLSLHLHQRLDVLLRLPAVRASAPSSLSAHGSCTRVPIAPQELTTYNWVVGQLLEGEERRYFARE